MDSVVLFAKGFIVRRLRRIQAEISSADCSWLSVVVFYAIIANIPYWVGTKQLGLLQNRGLFCVQFVTIGLLALVLSRVWSAGLLLLMIFMDILYGICETYYISIRQCVENIAVLEMLPLRRVCSAAAIVLLGLIVVAIGFQLPKLTLQRARRRAAICLIAFGILILGADEVSYRAARGRFETSLLRPRMPDGVGSQVSNFPRLARISMVRLARIEIADAELRANVLEANKSSMPTMSATANAIRVEGILTSKDSRKDPNIVLILVESWGMAVDRPLKDALVQPYSRGDVLARYNVIQGSVPFRGATIAGESRELCGKSFGLHLLSAQIKELEGCLPAQLDERGYYSIALHGMSGFMFDRKSWYRAIGFKERWFHEQFKQAGMPDCAGAFNGTCDADIAAWIGRRLSDESQQPYFIHWMTLNSHVPVPVPSPLSGGAPCLAADGLTPKTPLCSWYQLIANVHQSVAQVATGNLARPTVFIIVGDHAPPFGDPALHNRFSQTEVPYVVLLPLNRHTLPLTTLAHSGTNPLGREAKRVRQTQ